MSAQQGQVKSTLVEVKSLSTHLTTEAAAIVESLGSPGHQQVIAGNSSPPHRSTGTDGFIYVIACLKVYLKVC